MGRVVHFEIHASDPERSAAFYRELFGFEFTKWAGAGMDYWLVKTGAEGPGIDGGLVRRMGPPPAEGAAVNAFVCTIEVRDVDETLARATALGGTIALPKMPVPGVGWLAYLKDPDGTILGVHQPDPTAA